MLHSSFDSSCTNVPEAEAIVEAYQQNCTQLDSVCSREVSISS